jgi:hypothetical protein
MDITFRRFGGSIPRLAQHLLGADNAAMALDCKFWHGTLDPWRQPRLEHEVADSVMGIFQHGCCWFEYPTCIDVAEGPPGCPEVYVTGAEDYPVVITFGEECASTVQRLGVPCAGTAPSITLGASTAPKNVEGRSYAYQYVNARGERGALSRATTAQLVHDGQTVIVSGWEIPDASWDVTHVRIYRTVSSYQTGREPGNVLDTNWMFVGEAAIGAVSFTDNIWNADLISALMEDIAVPPPAGLQGIVAISGTNSLAGFTGNQLYFSENNSPHHWPYRFDLQDNICGIVESNGLLYVATDGVPYVVRAATDCKNAGCRDIVRLGDVAFPMTGCGNRHLAALPQGAVYPSHSGLILLAGNNPPSVLTHSLYAQDDWQRLEPSTVVPAVHEGRLFVFARGGSFVVPLPGGAEGGWPLDMHSELSDRDVKNAWLTRTGTFYLHKPDGIYEWNRGAALRPYLWISPEVVAAQPVSLAAGRAYHQHGALGVTIVADRKTVLARQVLSSKVFTLPMHAQGQRWQVRLEGVATVTLFSLASSMRELGA